MAVEHAPKGKKGLFGSLPQMGVGGGLVLSSLVMLAVTKLPEADMLSWGWRIPFFLSIVLLFVGVFIRAKVPESPEFAQMKEKGHEVKAPLLVVLQSHWAELLKCIGGRIVENAWFYIVATFSLAYAANQLHMSRGPLLTAITVAAALSLLTMPLYGWLSDRITSRVQFAAGTLCIGLFAGVFFKMLGTQDVVWAWLAIVIGLAVVHPILYAPQADLFCGQFPSEVRYTGISIASQAGGLLGGGLAPIIATWLLAWGSGDPHLVVYYIVVLSLVGFVSTLLMRRPSAHAEAEFLGPV